MISEVRIVLILSASLALIGSSFADDFESLKVRAVVDRQTDPLGSGNSLPGWYTLPAPRRSYPPESKEMLRLRSQRIEQKLNSIRIPKIDFEKTPLRDVLHWIRDAGRNSDQQGSEPDKGVNIVLKSSNQDLPVSAITMHQENITLRDALLQLAVPLGLKMEVQPYAVALRLE